MPSALRVQNLGKRYRVGTTPSTTLADAVRARMSRDRPRSSEFWALRGLDFDVSQGEALGIVGHNGAGKSTLLKILSRITEPTEGRIEVRGRVGALLEVGTGFHPELTGRENVFLNGSLLGMRRSEVQAAFDEIVDFSGVENFLDVPVKRYSSGMQVRLAFSVASSLRSDVLIVDEVLAVGDIEFQRRCMGRMAEASGSGRTVLFVSHNLAAVQALCTRALLLRHGQLVDSGSPSAIVSEYLAGLSVTGADLAEGVTALLDDDGLERPHLKLLEVRADGRPETTEHLSTGGSAQFTIEADGLDTFDGVHVGLSFWTETETHIGTCTTLMSGPPEILPGQARRRYTLHIPDLPLLPGRYWVDVGVRNAREETYVDLARRATTVTVVGRDVYGTGVLPTKGEGLIYLRHSWTAV